jgi:Domain of unknown function (DUF1707)
MPSITEARYDRRDGPRDRTLRVGDRERDAVTEILRQRHVEGRLDAEEFQTRLDRCLTAKTYGELDALIADFPAEERELPRIEWIGRLRPSPFLPLAVVLFVVLLAGGGHIGWVAVPLLFFFVIRPLAWRSRGVRGRGPWASGPRRTRRA